MIQKLHLTNFRSYAAANFELSPGITLVVGPNASGKTNLLESIYVLASTKSFRASDRDLVRAGQDHYRVVAKTNNAELSIAFQAAEHKTEKRVAHDKVKKNLADHIGTLQATLFEPSDMDLVWGAPERRRRYLDYVLCQTDPNYLRLLARYRRVLKQRNTLLANFQIGNIKDQIFAWDLKLTELATEIVAKRQRLLSYINGLADSLYGDIAGAPVELNLEYLPSVKGKNYSDHFLQSLSANLTRDLAAGFTTIGPHREDFKIGFNNNDITVAASRGEVRTVVLALKLAELAYTEQTSGQRPILLLDDVFSELDQTRRTFLMAKLQDYQSVVTSTEADPHLAKMKDVQMIETKRK